MKKSYTLLCIFFSVLSSIAQKQGEARIDSMLAVLLKMDDDSNKVELLNSISYDYYSRNPGEGLKYGKQALSLAEKLGWKIGVGESYKNIGNIYWAKSDYPKALDYYFKALHVNEEINYKRGIAKCLTNIALICRVQSDYSGAIKYHENAIRIFEELGIESGVSMNLENIAEMCSEQKDYTKALEYYSRVLKIEEKLNTPANIASCLSGMGRIFQSQLDFGKAMEYYSRALKLSEELGNRKSKALIMGYMATANLDMAGKQSNATETVKFRAFQTAKTYVDSAITIDIELGDLENLFTLYNTLSKINEQLGNKDAALAAYKNYSATKDSVYNSEKSKSIAQIQSKYEEEKTEALHQAELRKQKLVRNGFVGGFAVVLIFAGIFFRQRNKISKARKRSDELLLNILPEETAEELKATGTAKAKDFDEVTVLFTDFKNFTLMSERLSAQELVNEINYCYSAFDNIIGKYGIEKIKTIGDSYMCAGGLPVANKTNAQDIVSAALEIRDFMLSEKQKRETEGKPFFEIRIGCHTGSVVAGIVGIRKFAYDIWGDTVNIASRMESSGEAGKVNMSGATYELVKDKFRCEHRGKISAKNKGEIDMYFVEQRA